MGNWQEHTGRYLNRTTRLVEPLGCLLDALRSLPPAPLDFRPSVRGLIYYQLCIGVKGVHRSAGELCSSIEDSWISGHFISVSLCTRLLVELWGAEEFLRREILEKLERTRDVEASGRRISKFLLGAKSVVPLPWGGASDQNPIHVMDLVRQADCVAPGVLDDYEFLCDACHPTYLQHSYLRFAGSDYDNWSNEVFAAHGHQILHRTLQIAERSIRGITETGIIIVDATMPFILAERDSRNG